MPSLSVVVTVVDGGETLVRCLQALASQRPGGSPLEVIVPWDDTVPDTVRLIDRFPRFSFPNLGELHTTRPKMVATGQHELFDRRRAAGLAAATGDLVAILEDRGVPAPDWAHTAVRLHAQLPHAVIGGGVLNGRDRLLNWAVYFCDFGRYQPPFDAGPRDYVTDVNVCYKRRALAATADLWGQRYHEPVVHGALLRGGETLYLSPDLVVTQMRDNLSLAALIRERVAWGRLFAWTRVRDEPVVMGVTRGALSPALPIVLYARLLRHQLAKRVTLHRFLSASPCVLLLLGAWAVGESVGYFTRRP
jgi:hypothetical protein